MQCVGSQPACGDIVFFIINTAASRHLHPHGGRMASRDKMAFIRSSTFVVFSVLFIPSSTTAGSVQIAEFMLWIISQA